MQSFTAKATGVCFTASLRNLDVTPTEVVVLIGMGALQDKCQLQPGTAEWMIADRGYDADWFRDALKDKGIRPCTCIPGRKSRGKAIRYDKRRYRRNRIEIRFGRLKDWRRVATRYDRCAKTFLSAVALDATVIFWL